jgi:hypothetical protein
MSAKKISTILKLMHPQFEQQTSIELSDEQYEMMKDVIQEHSGALNSTRLYGMLARVSRRMKKSDKAHFLSTEYEYFSDNMMQTLKNNDFCRLSDTLKDINEIFLRNNIDSKPGKNRYSDSTDVISIFG